MTDNIVMHSGSGKDSREMREARLRREYTSGRIEADEFEHGLSELLAEEEARETP